ncbi:MAG: 4Fe-4S dicluster domain-containing protein [Oscillospiraceae bacterium]|jgi:ech hydrogenase subunit F|nr:4Fe-4S dicluster domain-containing protein [Oscillospiraceae bacterium]
MSYLHFARTILSSLFKKPATRNYPAVPRKYPEITRGKIVMNIENCIFCGMCMRKCPADAITVTRAQKKWEINPFSCIQCGCCVETCPKKCLSMQQQYTQPAPQKSEEVFYARVPDHPADSRNSKPAGK